MMKLIRSRFNLQPLTEAYQGISEWFTSPLGRRLLIQERKTVAEELRYLFGYHFMQLSSVKSANFGSASRINHCFTLAPDGKEGDVKAAQGVADYESLPLPDETVDVTVLHHVLEFSENPHQVLKEAARVTMPRGYIIIVAFNPLSIAGICHKLMALFSSKSVVKRRHLRAGRMKDWLTFLDCSCLTTRKVFHNLPINHPRYLASTQMFEKIRTRNGFLGGMSYIMVARKDKACITPIKPKWEKPAILATMPLGKQAIKNDTSKSCMVLPFRRR